MARGRRGCGCAIAALVVFAIIVALVLYFLLRRREERRLPPPTGGELQVHVLDVGQGDSILIISPEGKAALVDAGVPGSGRKILDAMNRYGAKALDLFVATHAHADHIGAADEVMRAVPTRIVLDSGVPNATKNYEDFLKAVKASRARLVTAEPGQTFDLGGGAIMTVLAPIKPFFTKEQLRAGGNEPNANSVVTRLDYGDFSILLTGDAEAQTEARMINAGLQLAANVLKVGHHGSRYATSDQFIARVGARDAIISDGADNRYGHPSQETLDRLRAARINVYRTDLQGEISIVSRGKGYEIKTERAAAQGDLWAGRQPDRDDSSRSGFVNFGDFGPSRPRRKERSEKAR